MRAVLALAIVGTVSCGGRFTSDAAPEEPTGDSAVAPPVAGQPSPIQGAGDRALRVAVGGLHACALIVDGTVRCWGSNIHRQIGPATTQEVNALPVKVAGLSGVSGVSAISAGGYHTCALAADRTVSCWGWNQNGQLGDGTTNDSAEPVRVVGLSDVVEISAGSGHTCARLGDGTVRCWGLNHQGQLGDGRTFVEAQSSPVFVRGLVDAASLSAGDLFTCATLADGSARCWGDDCSGELGDGASGSTCFRAVPVPVATLQSVTSISAASGRACASTSDGRAFCWGMDPTSGAIVDTPQLVAGVAGVTAVAAGLPSCALDAGGAVWCWAGELGTNNPRRPVAIVPGVSSVTQLSSNGLMNVCALRSDGRVFCWGRNDKGQVGDGTTSQRGAPSPVAL